MDERWTILVVDDDDLDRMAVRRALGRVELPLAIEEAGDSTTALEVLGRTQIDCIFLDYQLPGADAPGTLRALPASPRRHLRLAPVPAPRQ